MFIAGFIVAGSALIVNRPLSSGFSYAWWDANGTDSSTYFLEDVDLRGTTKMHGPFTAFSKSGAAPSVSSRVLRE